MVVAEGMPPSTGADLGLSWHLHFETQLYFTSTRLLFCMAAPKIFGYKSQLGETVSSCLGKGNSLLLLCSGL